VNTTRIRTFASTLCATLLLAGLQTARADHTDTCRTVSEADAAKLQGRTTVVSDIDGVLGQYMLLDYGPTNGAFLDKGITYPRADAALLVPGTGRR